jgi:hypothetical protein
MSRTYSKREIRNGLAAAKALLDAAAKLSRHMDDVPLHRDDDSRLILLRDMREFGGFLNRRYEHAVDLTGAAR